MKLITGLILAVVSVNHRVQRFCRRRPSCKRCAASHNQSLPIYQQFEGRTPRKRRPPLTCGTARNSVDRPGGRKSTGNATRGDTTSLPARFQCAPSRNIDFHRGNRTRDTRQG